MFVLPSRAAPSRLRQAWDIASDLLIATAVLWVIPLLLGAAGALFNALRAST